MRHDLVQSGGFLAIGGLGAATLNVVVPQRWLHQIAAHQIESTTAAHDLQPLHRG